MPTGETPWERIWPFTLLGACIVIGACVVAGARASDGSPVQAPQVPATPPVAPLPDDIGDHGAPFPAAPAKDAGFPNWTVTGNDPARGEMVLRCENAFSPEDGSGKCVCEGHELDLCVDGTRRLVIDRKQCGFSCKPTSQNARKIALRCPDGTTAETSPEGCGCSGRAPLNPCAGGIAATAVKAGECVVTCKRDQ